MQDWRNVIGWNKFCVKYLKYNKTSTYDFKTFCNKNYKCNIIASEIGEIWKIFLLHPQRQAEGSSCSIKNRFRQTNSHLWSLQNSDAVVHSRLTTSLSLKVVEIPEMDDRNMLTLYKTGNRWTYVSFYIKYSSKNFQKKVEQRNRERLTSETRSVGEIEQNGSIRLSLRADLWENLRLFRPNKVSAYWAYTACTKFRQSF